MLRTTGDLSEPRKPYQKRSLVIQAIHVHSLLCTHLHKLWVSLIVHNYKFQICLAWLVSKFQFYKNKFQDVLAKLICHKTNRKRVIRVLRMIEWNLLISFESWSRGMKQMVFHFPNQLDHLICYIMWMCYYITYGKCLFDVHK